MSQSITNQRLSVLPRKIFHTMNKLKGKDIFQLNKTRNDSNGQSYRVGGSLEITLHLYEEILIEPKRRRTDDAGAE